MASFKLTIVSPHGKAFEGDCESLVAPGREGDFGVLAGHASMIAMLRRGLAKVSTGDKSDFYVVLGEGYCEVGSSGVTILADAAHKVNTQDEARAELRQHLEAAGAK